MQKQMKKSWRAACVWLALFVVWTVLVRLVEVRPIGPRGSSVGFATVNQAVHNATGVHMVLYTLTDWLGLVPIAVCLVFGLVGLVQWIRRRRLLSVDRDLLALGGFYVAVMAVFLFFETVVINYRPVLIEGILEASYPSSTTLLVMCVMPTAMMQVKKRIGCRVLKRGILLAMLCFTVGTVVCRVISGVHWITDIIGGALLSAGLVTGYAAVSVQKKSQIKKTVKKRKNPLA